MQIFLLKFRDTIQRVSLIQMLQFHVYHIFVMEILLKSQKLKRLFMQK